MTMIREVVDAPLMAVWLPPDDFKQQARVAIDVLEPDFDAVYVSPAFAYEPTDDGDDRPVEYVGARWVCVRGQRMTQFLTERPQDLLDTDTRRAYISRARRALDRPA